MYLQASERPLSISPADSHIGSWHLLQQYSPQMVICLYLIFHKISWILGLFGEKRELTGLGGFGGARGSYGQQDPKVSNADLIAATHGGTLHAGAPRPRREREVPTAR